MEFGISCRIKEKEICALFNEGNLAQFGWSAENKKLGSYVVSFEFSRPKVVQIGPSRC